MRIILFLLLFVASVPAIAEDWITTPICGPLHYAGITVGSTTDSEVQRLLGDGVFRQNEGDAGARYFVDIDHTATLRTVGFTDAIIGELTLQEGIAVEPTEIDSATSKWFNPKKGFGKWHALNIGSTKDEVKSNLGEPIINGSIDEWRYDTNCTCELEVFFTIYFKNDRIWKVVFSAPSG